MPKRAVMIIAFQGFRDEEYAQPKSVLEKAGIVTTPGSGFGAPGEGYFRIALTVSKERLQEAVNRMQEIGF